jgi:ribosome-associated protein
MTDGEILCQACAAAAADKKAVDILILDLRDISTFTDYFVICSASSEPQLKAISSSVREQVRERLRRTPLSEDGYPASQWIILDYGDVIVHLFQGAKRQFYALENLWSDAKRIEVA